MSGAFPLWLEAAATATLGAVVAWMWLAPILGVDADITSGAAAANIRAEWEGVSKTPGGRVDRSSFKAHCLKKHGDKLTPTSSEVYTVHPGGRTHCCRRGRRHCHCRRRRRSSRSSRSSRSHSRSLCSRRSRHAATPPPRCHGVTPPHIITATPPRPALSAQVFLDRLFDTGTGLMLTPRVAEKADLGRHCFSYCNMLAGEFYFQQAADAQPDGSAACGCGTPVADVLQLVPPKK